MKLIIYKDINKNIVILSPAQSALNQFGLKAIAEKDVPPGVPYKIINNSDLPLNWPQETWEINDSLLTDGVGNQTNQFEEKK